MKKRIAFIIAALLCALLLVFNPFAMSAARRGFSLWQNSVLPALLPFFVCTQFMIRLGCFEQFGKVGLVLLSLVAGAPSGARLMSETVNKEQVNLSKNTAFAAAICNISPMYILGAFASEMVNAPRLALPIIISTLFSAVCYAVYLLRFDAPVFNRVAIKKDIAPWPLFGECLISSTLACLSVGAAIIFSMVLIEILFAVGVAEILLFPLEKLFLFVGFPVSLAKVLFLGLFEVTCAAAELANTGVPLRWVASTAAFLFSFCGGCIFVQAGMFLELKPLRYFSVKLTTGLLSSVLTFLLFPLFNNGLAPVFNADVEVIGTNLLSAGAIFGISLLCIAAIWLFTAIVFSKRRK